MFEKLSRPQNAIQFIVCHTRACRVKISKLYFQGFIQDFLLADLLNRSHIRGRQACLTEIMTSEIVPTK